VLQLSLKMLPALPLLLPVFSHWQAPRIRCPLALWRHCRCHRYQQKVRRPL
jgi:hypothetical protein